MKKYIVFVLAALMLGACASKRKAMREQGADTTAVAGGTAIGADKTENADAKAKKEQQIVRDLDANRQTARGIRSRISLTLTAGSKSATVGGTLKMKRDEIIQLSLSALGLFEVGRMELTPEYLFVQDRVNKQYVQVAWKDIAALRNSGADFYTFQALFWNELFMLGQHDVPSTGAFKVEDAGRQARLTPKAQHIAVKPEALQFLVDSSRQLLERTQLSTSKAADLSMSCDYGSFALLDGKQFPCDLTLAITSGVQSYTAAFTLSAPQVDEGMKNLATKPSGSYKRVELDDVIKGGMMNVK